MGGTSEKFSVTQYSIGSLLGSIESKDIAIPDIQRPFVWKPIQVRDLIDSLYNGYPTGYLIIWQNPTVRLKNGKDASGKKVLIDGQQRITAIMTAVAGLPVLTAEYKEKTIRIAFNPLAGEKDEHFAVQTPAHINSKEWISDIAELFKPDCSLFDFVAGYKQNNHDANTKAVENAFTRLLSIKSCQLGTIILAPYLEINEVTEIFVRINSQGKRLNEADFVMSKIAADEKYGGNMLRKAIDYFCHLMVESGFYAQISSGDREFMQSQYALPMAWLKDDHESIYSPTYGDMLRVSFMHIFKRAKMGELVSLLSGRDFIEHDFKEEIAKESFSELQNGVLNYISEYNFSQFVLAIKSAGFITQKLLNSKMTLDFAYALFLILQKRNEIKKDTIKSYIQKWFVLSTLTSRYISSPESQMSRDLQGIDSKGFLTFFQENEEVQLTDSFWDIQLVQNLETSSVFSPYFNTFLAAQIFAGDKSLLSSSSKVSDLITIIGDIHHIFPKAYLKKQEISSKSLYNQVANYIYLDTPLNKIISDEAPATYFRKTLEQCRTGNITIGTIRNEDEFWKNLDDNCIPCDIVDMTADNYVSFLQQRRKAMARKIKTYYYSL